MGQLVASLLVDCSQLFFFAYSALRQAVFLFATSIANLEKAFLLSKILLEGFFAQREYVGTVHFISYIQKCFT